MLALFGFFGDTREQASARTAELAIEVDYPTRFRYEMLHSLRLDFARVTNGIRLTDGS